MQKFAIRLILALIVLLSIPQKSIADTYPKREMRAAWVTTAWRNDWPTSYGKDAATQTSQKNEAIEYLDKLKAAGFNAVFFQVRGMCDRNYAKNSFAYNGVTTTVYEPWTSYLTNSRGTDPGWDPLEFWIEEAHKRGMELHAWINPYRFGNSAVTGENSTLSTKYPWSTSLDNTMINNGWIIGHHKRNDSNTGGTSYFILNPSLNDVKTRITNVCKVLTGNYDIDGIAFDDYFYPEGINDEGSNAPDYSNYQSYLKGGGTLSIEDWRRDHINDLISKVYTTIKGVKPFVKFGISPAGVAYLGITEADNCPPILKYFPSTQVSPPSDWQYNGIFSDPIAWMRNKTIDYISPQIYWTTTHKTNNFTALTAWWSEVANIFNMHHYPSHSLDFVNSNNTATTWDEVAAQVEAMRNHSIDHNLGSIFFASRDLTGKRNEGLAEYLHSNNYQKNAITPAINWYNAPNPGKPQNLKLSSNTLSWTATNTTEASTNVGMRYAVYAIPLNIGRIDAKSTIHVADGGFKADYLLDITYSNSFDVSSYSSNSYWYAVTIVDRYGNEWEAATINEPAFGDVSLSLNSPANNVSNLPFGDNTFSWTSDGSYFTFQISTSENFTDPLIEEVVTTNNITVSTANFTDGATYYWRVIASKENYNSAWSEVRSFTMEVRPFVSLTLLTPENASTIDSETVAFSWQGEEGANYTLEVAEFSSFNNIIISKNTTSTSYEITTSSLTGGKTYFWRIKATKEGTQSSVSSYSSFKIPKVEGELVDGITIEQKWQISADKFPENLASPRSMAAYNGNVYILERTTSTDCSLLKFNGNTGEYEGKITLLTTGDCYKNSSGASLGYPCNSIFVDGAGNLCVANMTLNLQKEQLTVCTVNVSTGATTRIFESKLSSNSYRIDYSNAFNNVTATGGQIWAATTSNKVFCWTNNGNGEWTETSTTINDYYPAVVTALGTAPYIQPISTTQFIVDGAGTHPTLYTFNSSENATLNSSFAGYPSIQPMNALSNGTCSITIGNTPLFVYVDDNHNGSGHSFSIVANKHNFDFAQFQFMKSIPENKLGKMQHDYALDQPVAIKNDDGSATIFLYAPKNGLAAYRISLPEIEISLNSPADNTVFEEDFDFSWNGVEGASYTLEISKTATFENIVFEANTTATSYNSSNFNFASETQYFWRVKASHPNYTANTSDVRQFTSPVSQSAIDNLTIKEVWNKSVNKGNFPDELGGDQRSMTAYNGNVYVTYRESSSKLHLLEFSGQTGEYLRQITLTGDCVTGSYGANGIFVDEGNNLCVVNMGTSSSIKLIVSTVDISTGKTTKVFEYGEANVRFDYANGFGDITKPGGQIWAGVSSSGTANHNYIYRWTRNSNNSWTTDYTIATDFQPSTGTNIGVGGTPWVMPISSDQFIVDGSYNYPTLYTFNSRGNATYIDGLKSNSPTDLKPKTIGAVGLNQLKLGKYPLFVYCNETHGGGGYDFNIVHNPSSFDFSNMEYCWTKPENRLGDESHTYGLSSIAIIKNSDNSATLFVYAPNNGLAAYRISLPEMNLSLTSPINNETVEKGFNFEWKGIAGSEYTIEVSTTEDFKNIAFSATTSAAPYSSTNFKLSPATKYYWRVKAVNDNYTTTTSSVGQFTTAALPIIPITLIYPVEDVATQQGFDFYWNGLEGSTYTLEVSTSENFENIAFTTTTTENSYNSAGHILASNSQYYWRVIATKEGYSTTTSAVAKFISPEKPTMTPPQLFVPYNWTTHSTDISFVAKKSYILENGVKKYTPKTTIEISTDKTFKDESKLCFVNSSNWKEEINEINDIWLQYTLPITFFANGTYYWRVIAETIDPNLEDGVSEIRQFTVENQYDESADYKLIREKSSYPELLIGGKNISLYNNWIRSATYGNAITQAEAGNYARGFCVRPDKDGDQDGMDIIYLAHDANPNNTGFKLSIDHYNAATGEFLGTLPLTAAAGTTIITATFPYNGFFVDENGALCFYNLATVDKVLQICSVDVNLKNGTAIATERFRYTVPGRIDHCRAYGNVINRDFTLYGAASATNSVYRWTVFGNNITFEDISLSSITNGFGYNIMAFPVNENLVYVDGSTSNLILIDFENGKVKSEFTQSNKSLGGCGFFIHNNANHFMVYPNVGGRTNHQYNISSIGSIDEGNSNTSLRWTIPTDENALPAHTLTTYGALVDYLPKNTLSRSANINPNSTIVYLYVPGSGLASYTISSHIVTGAEDVEGVSIKIDANNQEITFGCEVDQAQIYTLSGILLNSINDATSIDRPSEKGVYILRLNLNGVITTHKIVI